MGIGVKQYLFGADSYPEFLYHGRKNFVSPIPLEQGNDSRGKPEQCLFAVYATPNRNYAACFAVNLMNFKKGYLYKLKVDNFVNIFYDEWVSFVPEEPISYEVIYPIQFIFLAINGHTSLGKKKWFGVTLPELRTTEEDVKSCLGDINMESLDKYDGKTVAKRILYMDVCRAINKMETTNQKDEELFQYLYQLLKKLKNNWEEYIS
jgi:hypothetical protein